jgi:hypothetical protein
MSDEHWRAIDTVLSWPRPPARLTRPERLRARLGQALDAVSARHAAISRLRRIAGGEEPRDVAAAPPALAEDVACLRCLSERPDEAAAWLAMRSYLDRALPGPQSRDLFIDRAAALEQLSFVILLLEPHRFDGTRAAFEAYRAAYVTDYVEHHERYWQATARLRALLEEAEPSAQALARLNSLRGLGEPAGVEALAQFEALTRARGRCDAPDLAAALLDAHVCPACGVTMSDGAPADDIEETVHRLDRALAQQQARLAGEAVSRILAQGASRNGDAPARIDQFLRVVQASDVGGLARVLDDDLLAFLRDLLDEPVTPGQEAFDLLDRFVRAHPVISSNDVDAAADTLRRLLIERLDAERADDPARAPAVRLAGPS